MDGPAGIYVVADLAGAPGGAIAPLIGGWMDLFAARHFALTLEWSSPIHQLSVHVLSIRGLDFVFLISAPPGSLPSNGWRLSRNLGASATFCGSSKKWPSGRTESIRRFYRPSDEAKFPAVHIGATSPDSSRLR